MHTICEYHSSFWLNSFLRSSFNHVCKRPNESSLTVRNQIFWKQRLYPLVACKNSVIITKQLKLFCGLIFCKLNKIFSWWVLKRETFWWADPAFPPKNLVPSAGFLVFSITYVLIVFKRGGPSYSRFKRVDDVIQPV